MINKRLVLAILTTIFFLSATAGPVYERVLNNGLTLLVKEDHRAPIVYSSIWYKVGGSYEHNGITGISHVLEHMMFQGTQQYGKGKLAHMVEKIGALQNAGTNDDLTFYYQILPKEQLSLSFQLESDRMRGLLLTKEAFQNEIQVVMEERRLRIDTNPQQIANERLYAAAFVNNPYHHRAIGWMNDLENMTVNDVRHWYDDWYYPNNAVVVVVGDVNSDAVRQLAEHYFADIPAKPVPVLKPRIEVPPLGETHVNVAVPAKLPYLVMGYLTTSLTDKANAQDAYALDILAWIMGGSNSSRLQSELVRKQQVATSIVNQYSPFSLHAGLWAIAAVPATGKSLETLEQALRQQIQQLQTTLISEEELQRVKAQLIASKLYSSDSLSAQAEELGVTAAVNLPWQLAENYLDNINQITREQIQAVARKYFQNKRLTVTFLHPIDDNKKT